MIKEFISDFFHKPDGSVADASAAKARQSLYLLAFSLSIPATIAAMIVKPDAAAFFIKSETVFAVALAFAHQIAKPDRPIS